MIENKINKDDKYNFLKIINFINYKINNNMSYYDAEVTYINMMSKNIFFGNYINLINKSKYYNIIQNRVIVDENLNFEQRAHLLTSNFL